MFESSRCHSRWFGDHITEALRKLNVRVQLATWMDGAAARWPTIWERAGVLARTYITWRGSQRVQFSAAEIRQHDKRVQVQQADGRSAEELADFLAAGDIVRERDVVTAAEEVD